MHRETLIEKLTDDIFGYVMSGAIPESTVAASLKPVGLDDRFNEYDLLVDLHFALRESVIEFVERLPERLRSIRTDTKNVARISRGTVDGRINWSETLQTRYAQHPHNASVFVVENRSEDYDVDENLVLKQLISVVYHALENAKEVLDQEYGWVQATWGGDHALLDDLTEIVERNVHVRRIREPDVYEPTDRMITRAADSRQPIYREAATLLQAWERLRAGDPDELRQLLDETAITPDDDATLLELYVLFRIIEALEQSYEGDLTYETMKSGQDAIARMTTAGSQFTLYHNQAATDRDLSFIPVSNPTEDVTRLEDVHVTARDVASTYFTSSFENQTGRPDVFLIEDAPDHPPRYFICEVKNSTNVDTIRQGIKETLEYLAFLRHHDRFVYETPDHFGPQWNGLLVIQDIDRATASLAEQASEPITILQASDLSRALPQVFQARQLTPSQSGGPSDRR